MKWALLGLAVVFGVIGGYLWLALWADERSQRFYQATEPSRWGHTSWDWHG